MFSTFILQPIGSACFVLSILVLLIFGILDASFYLPLFLLLLLLI